jgi:hypothetical protein
LPPSALLCHASEALARARLFISLREVSRRSFFLYVGQRDRAVLLATLELVEKHVLQSERNIARQKELIAEMSALGVDVSSHRDTLANFEETQGLHTDHVGRLKQELFGVRHP